MTTFAEFRTIVARDLRDPDNKTFTVADLGDMVNDALAEVGRIAPLIFQEDITPVADTLEYVLRSSYFGGAAIPEIEVNRVELWDGSQTPMAYVATFQPGSGEYVNSSNVGWRVWGGRLYLANWQEDLIDPTIHLIRVWGYSPFAPLSDDADVVDASSERQVAMKAHCRVGALQRLSIERDLFTQWQTRSNNSDVSPAALMNALNLAQEEWRRRERKLMVLRSI